MLLVYVNASFVFKVTLFITPESKRKLLLIKAQGDRSPLEVFLKGLSPDKLEKFDLIPTGPFGSWKEHLF